MKKEKKKEKEKTNFHETRKKTREIYKDPKKRAPLNFDFFSLKIAEISILRVSGNGHRVAHKYHYDLQFVMSPFRGSVQKKKIEEFIREVVYLDTHLDRWCFKESFYALIVIVVEVR